MLISNRFHLCFRWNQQSNQANWSPWLDKGVTQGEGKGKRLVHGSTWVCAFGTRIIQTKRSNVTGDLVVYQEANASQSAGLLVICCTKETNKELITFQEVGINRSFTALLKALLTCKDTLVDISIHLSMNDSLRFVAIGHIVADFNAIDDGTACIESDLGNLFNIQTSRPGADCEHKPFEQHRDIISLTFFYVVEHGGCSWVSDGLRNSEGGKRHCSDYASLERLWRCRRVVADTLRLRPLYTESAVFDSAKVEMEYTMPAQVILVPGKAEQLFQCTLKEDQSQKLLCWTWAMRAFSCEFPVRFDVARQGTHGWSKIPDGKRKNI